MAALEGRSPPAGVPGGRAASRKPRPEEEGSHCRSALCCRGRRGLHGGGAGASGERRRGRRRAGGRCERAAEGRHGSALKVGAARCAPQPRPQIPSPGPLEATDPTCSDPEPGSRAEPFLLKGPFKGPFARVPPPTACSGRVNGPGEVLRKGFTFLFNSQRHGTPRNPRFREKQAGIPGLELFPSGISFSSPELAVEWT